jgi:hypothetical protein
MSALTGSNGKERVMRNIRALMLCLASAACMAVIAAASASAATPEWGRCLKVAAGTGAHGNAGCTTAGGKRDYSWSPFWSENPDSIRLESTTPVKFSTNQGTVLTCADLSVHGYIYESHGFGAPAALDVSERATPTDATCEQEGSVAGGEAGIIEKGATAQKDKVGLLLELDIEVYCGEHAVFVQGSAIVPVKANDTLTSETLKFTGKAGKQKPDRFEEPSTAAELFYEEDYHRTEADLTMTATATYEEGLEINSVV